VHKRFPPGEIFKRQTIILGLEGSGHQYFGIKQNIQMFPGFWNAGIMGAGVDAGRFATYMKPRQCTLAHVLVAVII
jgi:hypothetical protein